MSPHLPLQLAPNLKFLVHSGDHIEVVVDTHSVHLSGLIFPILEAFSRPATLGQVLQSLSGRIKGTQDWMNLTQTITQLHREGVLIDETKRAVLNPTSVGFDSLRIHSVMLNDRRRTETFLSAIAEVVKPGDVVVDIGTGTGILALAAARAGASRVYAIEATDIGQTAQAMFEANGFGDIITLVRGLSTQIELPERADVMVSEIIGNDPLDEQVLETTLDARKRLLKPGAQLVPHQLRVCGLPVCVPDEVLAQKIMPADNAAHWRDWYGFDFSPLGQGASDHPQRFFIKPQKAAHWPTLGAPITLASVDLTSIETVSIHKTEPSLATAAGELNGLLLYFELDLSPTITLSTHPRQAAPENHWSSNVWTLPQPAALQIGDAFDVTYRYRVAGSHDRLEIAVRP